MILTVTLPNTETFAAYYYGGADEVHMTQDEIRPGNVWQRYTLVYSDSYLARCQEGRFASGLYFCRLLEG